MFAFSFHEIAHFLLRYSKVYIWPWKFKVKVMAKVKTDGHIWGLKFNQYVCLSICSNQTILGCDIGNSLFDLENSRSRSQWKSQGNGEGQSHWSHLRPRVQSICLILVLWQLANLWLRYKAFIFDLDNSRSRSCSMSNSVVTFGHWVQSICLLFVSWQSDHFFAEI